MNGGGTDNTKVPIGEMPFGWAAFRIVAVASMEQIIGTGVSTVVGVMIPMMLMVMHHDLGAFLQGIIGAIGLIGIAFGSMTIGRLSDRQGYLLWFRLCPLIIVAGSLLCWLVPTVPGLIVGLFVIGIGVGGGYSLDSSYISELMPKKWRLVMVGVAKSTCSLGFVGVAVVCYIILRIKPDASIWNGLMLIIGAMGAVTFLLRIRWYESPEWLLAHGKTAAAAKAAQAFYGPNAEPSPLCSPAPAAASKPQSLFEGNNLRKVIYSGIPWACEGLAVYGFGVFMPVLLIALGIGQSHATGMPKIIESVEKTAVVNFFMVPGFVAGLLMMHRTNHVKMLSGGFLACAVGLGVLLAAYLLKLPGWIMIIGFVIFEFFMNWGPHLITYIIPSHIFPVAERGSGNGIAAMLGKVGAVLGVILMPLLLKWGGMLLVLSVSIGVMIFGAAIGYIYGRILKLV